MNDTGISIRLLAIDQTRQALASAGARFAAFSQSVAGATARVDLHTRAESGLASLGRRLITLHGSALALAAAFQRMSAPLRNVLSGMHELSDRAAESGSSASGLLALSHAFEELGVRNATVEGISATLARMRKATGDVGVEGFRRQMAAIAAIGDETARATELQRVFGREGVRMAHLVCDGQENFLRRLDAVTAALPKLSDRSIETASGIDKAFDWASRDIELGWKDSVIGMMRTLTGGFTGPVELELKSLWIRIKYSFKNGLAQIVHVVAGICDAIRMAFWTVIDSASVAINAIYDAAKNVWNAVTFDWDNVNWVHTERAADEWMKGHDWSGFFESMDLTAEGYADAMEKELKAVTEAYRATADAPVADIADAGEGAADALSAAADRLSEALKPARWTDAASYAARALALRMRAARDTSVGGAVGTGAARSASPSAATAGSAAAAVRPLIQSLLDALRGIGDDVSRIGDGVSRIAGAPALQLEAV